jgi:hypothetical protein
MAPSSAGGGLKLTAALLLGVFGNDRAFLQVAWLLITDVPVGH